MQQKEKKKCHDHNTRGCQEIKNRAGRRGDAGVWAFFPLTEDLRAAQPPSTTNYTERADGAVALCCSGENSWCRLLHQKRIKAVNVVIVEGLTQSHFYKHYLTLQHLRTSYTTRVTFNPTTSDLASGIFSSEVPKSETLRQSQSGQIHKALRTHPVITKFGTQMRGLTAYVLPQEEMIKRHFPVKGMPGFEEFVCTDSVDCVTDSSPLFSGITAAMLRSVTTTLRDVQVKLKTLLPSDAVLVGHSLNNDLMALKLIHQHVIDTSLLYRREFGQRFKLKVLAETVLKRQTKCPFLSVLQFSSSSDYLKRCIPAEEQQYQRVCANLRDMCVVFAGPFPAGFSEREVRQLFRCCGAVRKIKMLNSAVRVYAEVEFELLEGAVLAIKTLNGLKMQGQSIKVQRPVYESMLDLDLTLEALMGDSLNTSHLYAVKLNPSMADCIHISAKVNGHTLDAKGSTTATMNGTRLQHTATKSRLSEETVRDTFAHFGTVETVVLSAKPGKHARHAHIKFESSEGKHVALTSPEHLQRESYLVCPSLTPPHLPSWAAMTTPMTTVDPDEERSHMHISSQDQEMDHMMRKLDRRLRKLFRSLPDGTLSVVVLLGRTSAHGHIPGLCLMEVKQTTEENG
ncbi:RNA exonuclease 5 [Collichthys lucidus]|uniref:RNA exonuclease 5 n=1 Tax=Collichthys lucidus TaxID=240159 RepID=A0A4U5U337_COLLU|nr:RNA exonuclease 5 [Collichthys lucidus]